MSDPGEAGLSDVIRRELEAERERAKGLAQSAGQLAPRCAACQAIGTLEEIDGVLRCIDCDEVVAANTRLAGIGRR
jgi:hypothetical protein